MKILVTGANGFVGKNLISQLNNIKNGKDKTSPLSSNLEIFEYDIDSSFEQLSNYCKECDFVVNLAGVNRPKTEDEFMKGNFGFASELLNILKKHNNKCGILLSSSIQAALENPYGISKKAGEDLFFEYSKNEGVNVFIYRFTNLFGKWCRPNYNSAVATFCNNIANDLPITVNNRDTVVTLTYIDDVVNEIINAIANSANIKEDGFCYVEPTYSVTLGEIVDLLHSFKASRTDLSVPKLDNLFAKKLYSTYLSYLPTDAFSYPLKMNVDDRGSFTEIIRTADRGQFSVNISRPGIVKGNHWHHTKNEKFLVVSGQGVIRFRKIDSEDVIEYFVSDKKLEVVDIPVGYTHNIENLGAENMVTVMWCNECFDPVHPDTFFLEV